MSKALNRGRPLGIEFWITKPKPAGIFKRFIKKLFHTFYKETIMTKKKLLAKISALKFKVAYLETDIESWREAYSNLENKQKALQQSICDLVDKAGLAHTKKRVCLPPNNFVKW